MLKTVITSTPKLTKMLTVNKKMYFSNRRKNNKKSSTFPPPIFNALYFQNSFSFRSNSYQKNVLIALVLFHNNG